jgi:hypothetical protein
MLAAAVLYAKPHAPSLHGDKGGSSKAPGW